MLVIRFKHNIFEKTFFQMFAYAEALPRLKKMHKKSPKYFMGTIGFPSVPKFWTKIDI